MRKYHQGNDGGLLGKLFDYMLSNPPFGVEWKKIEAIIRKEFEQMGYNGRFGPGLPRVSDGSQTGEAAAKLKAVLSQEELAELNDGGEVSAEDILAAQMAARASDAGITYVAFTATPKNKTLELFGTRPDPAQPAGPGNLPAPFPRLFDAPGHRGEVHP